MPSAADEREASECSGVQRRQTAPGVAAGRCSRPVVQESPFEGSVESGIAFNRKSCAQVAMERRNTDRARTRDAFRNSPGRQSADFRQIVELVLCHVFGNKRDTESRAGERKARRT